MKEKQTAGRELLGDFAPKFAELNDEVLFGEIWSREQELCARDRSLITLAALISGGNFEQLPAHLQKAKQNGITANEIAEIITHLSFYVGWPRAWSAFNLARDMNASEGFAVKNVFLHTGGLFPLGDKVDKNFTGEVYLHRVITDPQPLHAGIGSVTFAPGARNHWHSHEAGQILLVTGGEGWYQEYGQEARFLSTGDAVNIPANVKHWHGAASDSWFAHLAITPGETLWLEPVDEADYRKLSPQ